MSELKSQNGASYLKSQGKKLSAFGEKVANMLGVAYFGIYHIEHRLKQSDFTNNSIIVVNIDQPITCFQMTNLMVLAHDMKVSVGIRPKSHITIEIVFSDASRNNEFMRMPSMEDAINKIRVNANKDGL